MKRAFLHPTSGLRPPTAILCALILSSLVTAFALTEANPYSTIVGRNTFALKPPAPITGPAVPPPTPPPNVSLQGISTILGRAQALLKVKIAPKPPDAAKELSVVLDVGQREGEVEVIAIDPNEGSVRISNQGSILTLNIKDGDKPIAGPAIPGVALAPLAMGSPIPGIPTQNLPPAFAPPNKGTGAGVIGAGQSPVPTRPLRAGSTAPGAASTTPLGGLSAQGNAQSSYQPPDSGLSADESVAALLVQHAAQEGKSGSGGPPLPPIPSQYLKK